MRAAMMVQAAEGGATPTYLATARYDQLITNDGDYFVLCQPTDSVRTAMVKQVRTQEPAPHWQTGL